jgi:hypothetical protein
MPENPTERSLLPAPYVFGASVIGPAHVARQRPCQDACAFAVLGEGLGVVAVADGLGSAPHAEVGAQAAVKAAVETVRALVSETTTGPAAIARQAMSRAREQVEAAAREQQRPLGELACTLIVVVFSGGRIGVAHIGDGAVVARTAAGLTVVSGPGDSEYANEVTPLTYEGWEKAARSGAEVEGVEVLAAFTDGCQRGCLIRSAAGHRPSPQFFEPLFSYAGALTDMEKGDQDVTQLLGSQRFAQVSEDDKTLVVAVLAQGPTPDEHDGL